MVELASRLFATAMKLPGTNKARALEVDFDPMPLAGAVERRKWRGDRADGRKENNCRPSSFRKPAGSSTTSALNFLPSALYFWPVAKNREDAHRFEQMETLATTCVRVYPADRPPQLRFLARLANEPTDNQAN